MSGTVSATSSTPAAPAKASSGPKLGKSGKKICCSCPETRKVRDLCVVEKGEDMCRALIEAHNSCLRSEGFNV